MEEERQWTALTVEQKYEILQMLEDGVPRKNIVRKYNISRATMAYIYEHRRQIKLYFEANPAIMSRYTIRLPSSRLPELNRILYQWCIRCMKNNVEISGVEIQRKALEINGKIEGDPFFKASGSWLQNFRSRNRISHTDVKEGFLTPTKDAANKFIHDFNTLLQDKGFTLENVYSASYTSLMWKAIPKGSAQEMCEDYVTTLFCTNATACHKLPVLVIGRIEETEASYTLNRIVPSIIYTGNTSGWMDSNISNLWFEECFLKSVRERQEKNGRREKTLLLLDNDSSLPDLMNLNKKDEFVTVISIPLDVTQLIQPINRGIIECFKRTYRKEFVKTLTSLLRDTKSDVINMHEKLNKGDCCSIVHNAWLSVDNEIMINAWSTLLNRESGGILESSRKIQNDVTEIVNLVRGLPGRELCDTKCVRDWFRIDNKRDMFMKICTDEVLRDFKNKTFDEEDEVTVSNEAGPSRAKFPKLS